MVKLSLETITFPSMPPCAHGSAPRLTWIKLCQEMSWSRKLLVKLSTRKVKSSKSETPFWQWEDGKNLLFCQKSNFIRFQRKSQIINFSWHCQFQALQHTLALKMLERSSKRMLWWSQQLQVVSVKSQYNMQRPKVALFAQLQEDNKNVNLSRALARTTWLTTRKNQ